MEGRAANHIAKSDIIKLAKSVNKCAASVAIARLFDKTPPENIQENYKYQQKLKNWKIKKKIKNNQSNYSNWLELL